MSTESTRDHAFTVNRYRQLLPPRGPVVTDPVAHAELRKTLELIIADVSAWNQENWGIRIPATATAACRTAYCVAGHYVVSVLGARPDWRESCRTDRLGDELRYVDGFSSATLPGHDEPEVVAMIARDGFGLTTDQANELFADRNSLLRVLDLAFLFTGGAVDLYDAYTRLVARDPEFRDREHRTERVAAGYALDVARFYSFS